MQIFRDGTSVRTTVSLVDETGAVISSPASATYVVLDENRNIVVASTNVAVTTSSVSVVINVPAPSNTLAAGALRGLRTIEVSVIDGSTNTRIASHSYALESSNVLVVMTNSYQTLEHAELMALEMGDLVVWSEKTRPEKIAALIDSYHRIGTLAFSIGWNYDQQKLMRGYQTIRGLNEWTANEFATLPIRFKRAIWRAQVVETEVILGGDNIGDQRREGLLSHTIGESSQMYRSGRPVMLPVSTQALKQLAGFVTYNSVVAR